MAVDFWRTLQGILARIADLAHDFTWRTINTAIRETVLVTEAEKAPEDRGRLEWVTMGDDRVCTVCIDNEGEYELKEPLPFMPAHVMCRCHWELAA